jgi:hypothetical protein
VATSTEPLITLINADFFNQTFIGSKKSLYFWSIFSDFSDPQRIQRFNCLEQQNPLVSGFFGGLQAVFSAAFKLSWL